MTPRSRKPVMLMGTLLSSSDHQSTYQNSFCSLREEDEYENVAADEQTSPNSNKVAPTSDIIIEPEPSSTSPTISNKFQ